MKTYSFGSCIPESLKIYNRLKKQGKNPKLVEGWVEVKDELDLLSDDEFLESYLDNNKPVIKHTWVIYNNKIIDKTKSQFKAYGGIVAYYEKSRYWFKKKKRVSMNEVFRGVGEICKDDLKVHYC